MDTQQEKQLLNDLWRTGQAPGSLVMQSSFWKIARILLATRDSKGMVGSLAVPNGCSCLWIWAGAADNAKFFS